MKQELTYWSLEDAAVILIRYFLAHFTKFCLVYFLQNWPQVDTSGPFY